MDLPEILFFFSIAPPTVILLLMYCVLLLCSGQIPAWSTHRIGGKRLDISQCLC